MLGISKFKGLALLQKGHTLLRFIMVLALTIALPGYAQDLVEFENGGVADADDLNTNFRTLQDAISALDIAQGATLLTGDGDPDAGLGSEGDVYIDTQNYQLFGPKAADGWSDGASLVGPAGGGSDSFADLECGSRANRVLRWNWTEWECVHVSELFSDALRTCTTASSCLVSCPSGSRVISGSCEASSTHGVLKSSYLHIDYPYYSWRCSFESTVGTIKARAFCLKN